METDLDTSRSRRTTLLPVLPRAMTRCECTGSSFSEITRRMEQEKKSLETLMAETGVGSNCTACIPDLEAFAARAATRDAA